MVHSSRYVRFLADLTQNDVSTAGGKAAGLAHLIRGGFRVPDGFVITTHAYDTVVAPTLDLTGINLTDLAQLERASAGLRQRVRSVAVPADLVEAVAGAYRRLGRPPVAVRSSGTSEDLPTASYAGQHETFLQVIGESAIIEAVRSCWASMWTARAVQYRARLGSDPANLSIAVIVQEMAPHDISGVVFTVNPISGNRDELLINAARGTGESLVAGHITPDQWIARRPDGAILQASPAPIGSGLQAKTFLSSNPARGCLTASQVRALSQLALQVEAHFDDVPQDIEWSFGEGAFFLLQSRPVTT